MLPREIFWKVKKNYAYSVCEFSIGIDINNIK